MENQAAFEFETFSKCIEVKFGPDMEKKIRNNIYTNYGDTKRVFDHMFTHFYSEKNAKLVKSNLEINNEDDESAQRKAKLRLKNIELKKKIAKVKSKIEQEDIDKSSICKQTIEQQKRLAKSQNDFKKKEITSITQDVFIQKVQGVTNKFETIARNLNFISAKKKNEKEDKTQNDLENLMSGLRINCDAAADGAEFTAEADASKLKQLNLNEVTNYYDNKIENDLEKAEKSKDAKLLGNEVQLLLYKLDSKNNIGDSKPTLNIQEKINENHIENLRRDCERKKWAKEKLIMAQYYKEYYLKLNEYLKLNYRDMGLRLYAQLFGSYLQCKKKEYEYNDLKLAVSIFEAEIQSLSEETSSVRQKSTKLKELINTINVKQESLDQLLEENSVTLDSKLNFNICQLKSTSESFLELINEFSMGQLNKSKMDTFQSTLQASNLTNLTSNSNFSSTSLLHTYTLFKEKFQIESKQEADEFTEENKATFKKLLNWNEFNDQKVLFENFTQVFRKLKSRILDLEKLNRNQSKYGDIQRLGVDIERSLANCKTADENELFIYVDKLMNYVKNMSRNLLPEFKEIENIITIWQTQPGAYDCIPDDLTVNGKTLGYFMQIINKLIAQNERTTFAEQEQVNEQIKRLIQYCSSY